MNSKEIEELREKVYEMSNSMLPLNTFFNDIRDNPNENYDKELAYNDLSIIVDYITKTRNRLEKLERVVDIIKNKNFYLYALHCTNDVDDYNSIVNHEEDKLTQEEYKLMEEVLRNENK